MAFFVRQTQLTNEKKNILCKKVKSLHRTIVKAHSGVVRVSVVESTIIPFREHLFSSDQKNFRTLGQEIHARRNTANFDSFEQFMEDSSMVAFVETVFKKKDKSGMAFFAYSCNSAKSASGVKGKTCWRMGS